jgi:putative hydrolase of the HAD superfamily
MIKNIIFDLGNVLLSWKPDDYFKKSGFDSNTVDLILKDVFKSPEWLSLDNGDISTQEAIEQITLKSSLKKDFIYSCSIKDNKSYYPLRKHKLLPQLKKKRLEAVLSFQLPAIFFEEVKTKYDFFNILMEDYFCRGKTFKQDVKIYHILLDK